MTSNPPHLLTRKDIEAQYRIPRSTLYQRIKDREFPPPIKIGRGSFWIAQEISDLIEARMRARGQ